MLLSRFRGDRNICEESCFGQEGCQSITYFSDRNMCNLYSTPCFGILPSQFAESFRMMRTTIVKAPTEPPTTTPATPERTTIMLQCKSWCSRHRAEWPPKCKWTACGACAECRECVGIVQPVSRMMFQCHKLAHSFRVILTQSRTYITTQFLTHFPDASSGRRWMVNLQRLLQNLWRRDSIQDLHQSCTQEWRR